MLEVRALRADFEGIKRRLEKRGKDFELDKFLELDKQRRELIAKVEALKAKQNAASKEVPKLKKEGKDTTALFAEMKELSDEIAELDNQVKAVDEAIEEFLLNIPNAPYDLVAEGADSDANVEVRRIGEPKAFEFEPLPHWELGEKHNILDLATGAKVTGTRFVFYRGLGARLERAIMNLMLDMHVDKHGYTEVLPPYMVHRRSMVGTGQLPKFEEDAFKVANTEYFLVPTAEVPVTNMHRESILSGDELPIKYCAFSPCFRAEAGSAGRDTRGIIRLHQFQKVELVKFARPDQSYEELEKLVNDAEEILQVLGLPYRVVRLCGGDLGFSSAMTYDIEVWMPSYGRYVEISSCSNFESFQSVRAEIKFKADAKARAEFVHTLNGSGLALGRTTAAVLENFQQADGSIIIPDVLVPYMNGITEIK